MGLEGVFYGFGLWKMKFLNIPLIFAGFVLLGRCLPATCTEYYGFKRMTEEQGMLIQQKKLRMQKGLNPWLQGERPAPKPLTCSCWGHHSSIWLNLLRLSFEWTCITPDVPSRRLWSLQSLIYEHGATKINSGPKKVLSLSLDVKCDQQTHKKLMSPIRASISRTLSNKVP